MKVICHQRRGETKEPALRRDREMSVMANDCQATGATIN